MPASEVPKTNASGAWSGQDFLCLPLAACPALLLTIWWHLSNHALPIADAAAYLSTAQSISQKFDLDGIRAGLVALYLDRGWRPTIYPPLTVPFHWIDKADIGVVVSGASILFTTLLCYWTYLCFRAVLSPWRAAVATIACTTVPFRLLFSFNFFSELPLLSLSTGAVAYLLRSDSFRHRQPVQAFSLLLALAACARPVESVMALAPPLLFAMWLGYRRGVISWRDIGAAAGIAMVAVVLIFSQLYPPLNIRQLPDGLVCGLMLGFLLGGLGLLRLWRPCPIVEGTYLLALIILFWWLPAVRELFVWLVGTTVGGITEVWPLSRSPLALLGALVHGAGVIQFALFAGIFPYLLYERIAHRHQIVPTSNDRWTLLAALPLALVVTLLPLVILAQSNDPRRILLPMALTSITVLAIALRPGVPWARPFVAVVTESGVVQIILALILVTNLFPGARALINYPFISVMEVAMLGPPYSPAPGPDQRVFAALKSTVPDGAGVILIDGAGRHSQPPAEVIIGAFNDYALAAMMGRRPQTIWTRIPDWSVPYDRFLEQGYYLGAPYVVLGNTAPVVHNPATAWQLQDAIVNVLAGKQLLSNYNLEVLGRTNVPERGVAVVLELVPRDGAHNWDVYPVVGAASSALGSRDASELQNAADQFIDDRHPFPPSAASPRQVEGAGWVAREADGAIPGRAWLGYAFATPQTVREIRLWQPIDHDREDLVRVEKSVDEGATWTSVTALPFRLAASDATSIILPDGLPAGYWRIVAAGLEETGKPGRPHNDWQVSGLQFLVPSHGGGLPIGSEGHNPERAFAADTATGWASPEHGLDVKGHAWVGYAFDTPQVVRSIEFVQSSNPRYRQDRVMVQASSDAGLTWHDVLSEPATVSGQQLAHIDLPNATAATHWRVVAAADNAAEPAHSWAVADFEFFLAPNSQKTPSYAAVNLADGAALSSGEDAGAPQRAFDGDAATYWFSAEHGGAVKDHAWIGYRFSQPRGVRRIDIEQPSNHFYRQDLVRVEKSVDGGNTWQPGAPQPFPLMGSVSRLFLPAGEPARLWRIVAEADNSTKETEGWAVETLAFYASAEEAQTPALAALPNDSGRPIASGDDAGVPGKAFDGDPATYWLSPEHGGEVKDHAWIGYAFAMPREIRQIHIEQQPNPFYRQDLVRVEKSLDGGSTWQSVAPGPFRLKGTASEIDLPAGEPAVLWRVVAAGDNAVAPEHAWAVNELKFFAVPDSPSDTSKPRAGK